MGPVAAPEWLTAYRENEAARRSLPAGVPVVLSNHASLRGKERGGLSAKEILSRIQAPETKVIRAGDNRWVALLGELEAVLSLRGGALVVVTLCPAGPLTPI